MENLRRHGLIALVGYFFDDKASLTFIVNNVFNKGPRAIRSMPDPPHLRSTTNYNVFGRQFRLEFDVHFGSK